MTLEIQGTNECIRCERPFTAENPCCCDYAFNEDGRHVDGVCVECCQPHPHRNLAGYERMDCDQ